ncbi:MAG: minor extracellular serine protease Vpr, partial [Patiriisocius sp.]
MRNSLLILVVLFCFQFSAQVKISQNCKADIQVISKDFKANGGETSEEVKSKYAISVLNGVEYVSLLAEVDDSFNSGEMENSNLIIGAEILDIVSLKIPLENLEEIYNVPGILTLQLAGKIISDLDRVRFDTRVDSVHAGINLPQAYTGQDVLIGITDWGFDYSSPMFYDTLLQETRILAAWDQFKNSGPSPDNYDYGTEYNTPEDLLLAGADTANIYSFATHGSHVAGIAAGSGAGTEYRGMAFNAQYLFTTFLVDEASVLDAWQWMYDKSVEENKRLVINMSWGLYYTGALDGTSLLSQALDGFSDLGVLFVTSNGNNGNVNFHINKNFENDTLKTRVNFYSSSSLASLWGQSIHGWGEPGNPFTTSITILNNSNDPINQSPWYSTSTTNSYVDSYMTVGEENEDTIFYNLSMDDSYPTNERPQMRLRIKRPSFGGIKVILNVAADGGDTHFWNVTELSNDVGNWGMPFSTLGLEYTAGNSQYGVGAPACSQSSISVAAHTASYQTSSGSIVGGLLASFSSKGPIMTGDLKPDISAPGVNVASSISSYTDNSFNQIDVVTFNERDYPFAKFSGTSMSSPAVAGISALILEANPFLSPAQVKQVIIETAREDSYTGDIDDEGSTSWGHGKINAYLALQSVLGL